MRRFSISIVVLLTSASMPQASAGAFDFGADRLLEELLQPGEARTFRMPLKVNQDGLLYAKLLVTDGNAVNNGTGTNGSVEEGTGWRISFEMVQGDNRTSMGTYVDSTVSTRVPVKRGDEPTLEMTVHIPLDAAKGGPRQRVNVALAYRISDGTNPGSTSGASIEESRAITLLLTNDALAPWTDPAANPPPKEDDDNSTAIPPAEGIPTYPTGNSVAPQVFIVQSEVPVWFLMIMAAVFAGILAVMVGILAVMFTSQRHPPQAPAPTYIPVYAPPPAFAPPGAPAQAPQAPQAPPPAPPPTPAPTQTPPRAPTPVPVRDEHPKAPTTGDLFQMLAANRKKQVTLERVDPSTPRTPPKMDGKR